MCKAVHSTHADTYIACQAGYIVHGTSRAFPSPVLQAAQARDNGCECGNDGTAPFVLHTLGGVARVGHNVMHLLPL